VYYVLALLKTKFIKGTKLGNQKNYSALAERARASKSLKTCVRSLFLTKGGIDQNKSYKGYKVRQPKTNPAQSERACVRTSPKTCKRGLFLIKEGISGQIHKNKK
jgi:hypothetical protein